MFTVEASYTVPISIAVILFVVSFSLYMHDITLMNTSAREAAYLWKNAGASEREMQNYLQNSEEKLYLLENTYYKIDEREDELKLTVGCDNGRFFSVVYMLLNNGGKKKIEYSTCLKKYDLTENMYLMYWQE